MILTDPINKLGYHVLDPTFNEIVDTSANIDILASGFSWAEGPLWVPRINSLLFSDVAENTIYRWGPKLAATSAEMAQMPQPITVVSGLGNIVGAEPFLYPSGYLAEPETKGEPGSNGLKLDALGRLFIAQHGERRIAMWNGNVEENLANAKPDYTEIVSTYKGKKLNSPNDLVFAANGDLYFTDPTYGVDKTFGKSARELDITGVYRVKSGSSEATLMFSGFKRPNGIDITPDGKYLIVSNSGKKRALWMKFDISDTPNSLEDRGELFADVSGLISEDNPGICDGLVIHPNGSLIATGPGGVLVLNASGKHLGTIRTGREAGNVTLGGSDGNDIFIASDNFVLRARLS